MRTFVATEGDLTFVVDEPWGRRWGRRINARGHDCVPLAASKQRSVATSGVRWIGLTLVITPLGTPRSWALPVLSVPVPTPALSRRLVRRHKMGLHRARQMRLTVRRCCLGWR